MAFQAEQRIKVQIIKSLGPDQIFRLLSDGDINVIMKTLGLLRNLLSNKQHIDHIMASYGKQIMQVNRTIKGSDLVLYGTTLKRGKRIKIKHRENKNIFLIQAVVLILESDYSPEVKEQALCILANIADGVTAKEFIMSNEDVLKKITNYMMHHNEKLRVWTINLRQSFKMAFVSPHYTTVLDFRLPLCSAFATCPGPRRLVLSVGSRSSKTSGCTRSYSNCSQQRTRLCLTSKTNFR